LYQLTNEAVLFDWLAAEPDPGQRVRMLEWLSGFCEAPLDHAVRVPGIRAQVYIVLVPVRNLTLRFLFAEQFKTIKMIEFVPLP
jgi:hypothetical protein